MTTPADTSACESCVITVVEDAHEHAVEALRADRPLDAVVWLSAHLAAVARTITPAALRHLDAPAGVLREQRRRDLELERLLRIAERRHSGDVLASGLDAKRLRGALLDSLRLHSQIEHQRLEGLAVVLEDRDQRALANAYLDALAHAPTRPHPHLPHNGLAGAIAFRVDALRDRVMDTMDARHVPLPRPRSEQRRPGRWGSYLLGQMQPSQRDPSP